MEHNAWELKQYIEELYWGSGKRVMLLGHSQGRVDGAAALSMFWDDLKGKVAGLALFQSPYGSTPVASDILRKGQIADKETRRIMELIICKLIKVLYSLKELLRMILYEMATHLFRHYMQNVSAAKIIESQEIHLDVTSTNLKEFID